LEKEVDGDAQSSAIDNKVEAAREAATLNRRRRHATARTQTEKQEEREKGEKLPSPRARKGLYEQPDDVERPVTR
jgi:hypothetical protein